MYDPTPFFTGYLPEVDGHQIYYEQYGNVEGPAIIVLHGGPGSKSKPRHIKLFDTNKYHIITFHQRGCGKSLPQGEINHNTTADLIVDMERLREQIKVEQWYVAGGSWGSTLALAYSEAHPNKVRGLLISSIFLGRKQDVAWSFTEPGGIDKIFTDLWHEREKFLTRFGASPQNAAKILLSKIMESNQEIVKEIVAGVMNWEGNLMSSQIDLVFTNPTDVEEDNINAVKVFLHYESHDSFLSENQLLNHIHKIKKIPTIIVHGRYDLLCTLDQMWTLTKSLPNSEYVILPSSNHKLTADGEIARRYAFQYFLAKHSH